MIHHHHNPFKIYLEYISNTFRMILYTYTTFNWGLICTIKGWITIQFLFILIDPSIGKVKWWKRIHFECILFTCIDYEIWSVKRESRGLAHLRVLYLGGKCSHVTISRAHWPSQMRVHLSLSRAVGSNWLRAGVVSAVAWQRSNALPSACSGLHSHEFRVA
jgi:hypothetical protein